MAQETRPAESPQEKQKEKLLAKLEEFKVLAAQAMITCEALEKELRGN